MTDLRALSNALFAGDTTPFKSAMIPQPTVQDQRMGVLKGEVELQRWVTDTASWLDGLEARPRELAYITTDGRSILELSLSIRVTEGVVDLPFVIVADRQGEAFEELRTYHSTWPYTGDHAFRAPPLAGRTPEAVPEVFLRYIEQVRAADVDAILKTFTTDGYVREPSGDRWKHQGIEGRAKFYGHLPSAPRAQFDLMTSTADDRHIAVEYGFAYGDVPFVGGICIMETQGDQIAAVRITDDVGV